MTNFTSPGMGTYGSTWQSHGYSGAGNVEELIDSIKGKVAIVAGSAHGVFDEVDFLRRSYTYDEVLVFAVNDVGMFLERVDHWVSQHGDQLPYWQAVRWLHAKGEEVKYHSGEFDNEPINYTWHHINPSFALSGYFAAQIAYIMGAERIILCGCPGSKSKRFFESNPRLDNVYGSYEESPGNIIRDQFIKEMERLPDFKSRMRSMSGWTKEFLGGL